MIGTFEHFRKFVIGPLVKSIYGSNVPPSAKHHAIIGTQMQPECYSQEKKFLISDNLVHHATSTAAVTSVVSNSVQPHRRQPTRLPHPWDSPGKNSGVGCHFLLQRTKVKSETEVAQLCLTLRDPMDCSPPGSSVHGIFQARVLEWGAIA